MGNKIKTNNYLPLFFLVFLGISMVSSIPYSQAEIGDTVLWESGEGKPVLKYIKGTMLSINETTDTVYIDYREYDLYGELTEQLDNISAGISWKSPNALVNYLDGGATYENITAADRTVVCVLFEKQRDKGH